MTGIGVRGFLGLLLFGMLGVGFNFFQPLTSTVFRASIFFIALLGGIICIKNRRQLNKIELCSFVAISCILAMLAASMRSGYDGGLYHLPHQVWLRTEPIVVGLANLHGRFGFSSLYEYMGAALWVKDNFILLSYLQASFIVFFLLFLIEQSRNAEGAHQVLLLGVVANFIVFHDYIYEEKIDKDLALELWYTYTDLPAGILFTVTFLYGHWLVSQKSSVQRNEWSIFSLLLLAALLLKISSVPLVLWFLFVVLYRIVSKRDNPFPVLISLVLPTGFMFVWFLKNIISTGCLLYPLSSSCIDVPWSAKINALKDAQWITAWARHPGSGLYSLQDNGWFLSWWYPHYYPFLIKLLLSGGVVGILYVGIALRSKFASVKVLDIRFWGAVGVMALSLLFWFWKAPTPRFGIGVFFLFFPVVFLFFSGYDFDLSVKINKPIQVAVIVGLLFFSFYIGTPWKKISQQNLFSFKAITVPTPKTQADVTYGVRVIGGDQCWLSPQCSPYDRPPLSSWHGVKTFYNFNYYKSSQ
ncbi:MAG: hypothetical protein Q3M24_08780 [Candidatus Electrothrix aestuarii]|uniref:DUF8201 domain-containing protein n=1 Tax=Candidatus Electrothrix aestuarii TaxID=3062594 RepID=A0AAU8LZX5_9BACT|nr:hypothetical protein [Candidatus Electrothrix aestuarii]